MSWKSLVVASAACVPLLMPILASAQVHDHLKCYKVKDPSSFSATADLRPADQSNFQLDPGCSIKVRSRQLCIPVRKELLESDAPSLDIAGPDLANAFLCYKVRCPGTPPESLQMSDQFGTRTLTGLRTTTICAPAILGAPPVTTTTTSTLPDGIPRDCTEATPPSCDGTCNNNNLSCEENAGACVCIFRDVFGGCPRAGAGAPECWGTCDGIQTCLEVSGGCGCGFAFE
jgi:hypothetical protein